MSALSSTVHALVPCAGAGVRAGTVRPKQYTLLTGQSVVERSVRALLDVPRIQSVLVVVAPGDTDFLDVVPAPVAHSIRLAAVGGDTRAQTVLAGLNWLLANQAKADDWVLVHDAARCLVSVAAINRLLDACLIDEVGGLLAMPLADTLKQATQGRAQGTLSREGKWAAQTPQMFRLGTLHRALTQTGHEVTDEASAIEGLGLKPLLVRGDAMNVKITWPEDFDLARRWLAADPGHPSS